MEQTYCNEKKNLEPKRDFIVIWAFFSAAAAHWGFVRVLFQSGGCRRRSLLVNKKLVGLFFNTTRKENIPGPEMQLRLRPPVVVSSFFFPCVSHFALRHHHSCNIYILYL